MAAGDDEVRVFQWLEVLERIAVRRCARCERAQGRKPQVFARLGGHRLEQLRGRHPGQVQHEVRPRGRRTRLVAGGPRCGNSSDGFKQQKSINVAGLKPPTAMANITSRAQRGGRPRKRLCGTFHDALPGLFQFVCFFIHYYTDGFLA